MKGDTTSANRGFIQLLIILVLVVIILSLLGVSLSSLFQNKTLQENFGFIGDTIRHAWSSWAGQASQTIWDMAWPVIHDYFWIPLRDLIANLKSGGNLLQPK